MQNHSRNSNLAVIWLVWWKHVGHEEATTAINFSWGPAEVERVAEEHVPSDRTDSVLEAVRRPLLPWLHVEESSGEVFPPKSCHRTWLVFLLQVLSYPPPQPLPELAGDASVLSAAAKGRCKGDTCTHVKPLSCTYSPHAGLRHRSQRKRGFLARLSLLQSVMSGSGGRRLGVLAGLAQKGSICACLDIKGMQKPKGILTYGPPDFLSKNVNFFPAVCHRKLLFLVAQLQDCRTVRKLTERPKSKNRYSLLLDPGYVYCTRGTWTWIYLCLVCDKAAHRHFESRVPQTVPVWQPHV